MTELSLAGLEEIIGQSAGEDETAGVTENQDVTFDDLGYDSLALLEVVNRIERTYHVKLPEDELTAIRTPNALIAFVNERLKESAA
ncbi:MULTISPECIES: acyl carrier protein [Streptomyces]|uniref:acyl carrier protein n=1 Tax=Streptomyces TaxID=1883 RepID=UPI000B9DE07D|nr:acyl carrier protein [Streptomyces kasugaensis]